MCHDISNNYKNNINSYVTILNNLNLNDCLDIDINNHSIGRNMVDGEVEITPESEFDIISTDLWNNFTILPFFIQQANAGQNAKNDHTRGQYGH